MDNKETREAYQQVANERQALVKRTKQTTKNEDSSSSDGESSQDSDADGEELRAKAVEKIEAELRSDGSEGSDGSSDS